MGMSGAEWPSRWPSWPIDPVRELPQASDRDRLSAARYAVERILRAMRGKRNGWQHTQTSHWAVVSRKMR